MQEAIGHVRFSFTSCLRPWGGDPEQYWIEVTGRIMALPDEAADDAEAEPAGTMEILHVRVAEARDDEVRLFTEGDALCRERVAGLPQQCFVLLKRRCLWPGVNDVLAGRDAAVQAEHVEDQGHVAGPPTGADQVGPLPGVFGGRQGRADCVFGHQSRRPPSVHLACGRASLCPEGFDWLQGRRADGGLRPKTIPRLMEKAMPADRICGRDHRPLTRESGYR